MKCRSICSDHLPFAVLVVLGTSDGSLPGTGIARIDQHRGARALSSGLLSNAMEEEINARLQVAYTARAKASNSPVEEVRASSTENAKMEKPCGQAFFGVNRT